MINVRVLKELKDIDLQKYQELKEKGWLNHSFLELLTPQELIELLNIKINTKTNLIDIKEILEKIKKKRNQKFFNDLIETGDPSWYLSTGSENLNKLLSNNGISSKKLTLLYGKFRTGKSQIAHQCCVQAYNQYRENLPNHVSLFLDTEGTFRPERINEMSISLGLPAMDVLKQIYVIQAKTFTEFKLVFVKIEEILKSEQIKFMVIDSLTNFIRLEIAKKEKSVNLIISDFSLILRKLSKLAIKFNIPILCTSQVVATFNEIYFFNVNPILSNTLNTYIKDWVLLGENPQITTLPENYGRRFAHLINNETIKEHIIQFRITSEGIKDFY